MIGSAITNFQLRGFFVILISFLVTVITAVGIFILGIKDQIHFENPTIISYGSLVLFIVLCLISIHSDSWYFFLLPFIFLAYPAAVNDFAPGVLLGVEPDPTIFPLLTHIDVFLILGIVKQLHHNKKLRIQASLLIITTLYLFFGSSLINIFQSDNMFLVSLLLAGLFPLRFLILIVLLVSNSQVPRFERQIINGLVVSVLFLLLESYINTKINHEEVLTSGSLAANTFGNAMAAIMVFFIFLKRNRYRIGFAKFILVIVACGTIIILTETRMAIVAAIISFIIIQWLYYSFLKSFLIVSLLAVAGIAIYLNIDVPKRYSISELSSKITFNYLSWDPLQMFSIERTAETSSIYTRLKLYRTAINMTAENPYFGTGYGTFNYLKNEYGFDEMVLLDAHNGYLNTLSQMGLSAIFLLYFIYFFPLLSYSKIQDKGFLKYLFVINITLAIADVSNAGIYKYSVFALLAFNSILLSSLRSASKLSREND